MFKFFKKRKEPENQVERVYQRLLPYQEKYQLAGLNVDYRRLAPTPLVQNLLNLSDDIQTTVHLVRVLHQRQAAEGMLEKVDVAAAKSEMGDAAAKKDADEHYESIKVFCDSIIDLVDSGEIARKQAVGNFLDENISAIMAAGAQYSMRFS